MTGTAVPATASADRDRGARRRGVSARFNWPGTAFLAGLIVVWQLAVTTGMVTSSYLPSPAQILVGLAELLGSGQFGEQFLHTVSVVLGALVLAAAVGILLGLALGLSRPAWSWTGATIDVLRSLPVIALVPVALVIFGLSGTAEMWVAGFAALWPIVMNTVGGVRQLHDRLFDVGRTLGLSRSSVLWKIALPGAAPAIMVGLRLGMTISLLVTVTAEMVGNPAGLGYGLVQAQASIQPARMYAYILVILVLGLVLNAVLVAASRVLEAGR